MSISEERADRIFKALGALEAGLIAIERAKTDRTESGVIASKFDALEKDKADRIDLLRLRDAIMQEIHGTVADLSDRIGGRFDATHSQIYDLRDRLAGLADRLEAIGRRDEARSAEIERLGDVLDGLAKLINEQAKHAKDERQNRWKRWRRYVHAGAQYAFQAFAALTFLIILIREGVTGLPDALALIRTAFGSP